MAYGARLESVLGESPRGFESPILREVVVKSWICVFLEEAHNPHVSFVNLGCLVLKEPLIVSTGFGFTDYGPQSRVWRANLNLGQRLRQMKNLRRKPNHFSKRDEPAPPRLF